MALLLAFAGCILFGFLWYSEKKRSLSLQRTVDDLKAQNARYARGLVEEIGRSRALSVEVDHLRGDPGAPGEPESKPAAE